MNEEEIDRIVESSKRMQEVAEFTNNRATDELFEAFAESILELATAMNEQTELSDQEIASAISGSVAGILIGWVMDYQDE